MNAPEIIINVDDNEPARYAKGRILERAGFKVYSAGNGIETLQMIEQHHPDLVLLDVNLPDVGGIEVCRRIKTTPDGAAVIVLQISASAIDAPQAMIALDSGADAYLTEPVDPGVLVATVRALLRLRRVERQLSAANDRLKVLNRELTRSNDDLQQFAFAASHDLQEPLRTVTSFVSLLERRAAAKLSSEEKDYLRFISDASGRMRTLINDLLRYSQVGQKLDSVEVVDLNEVLLFVLKNLQETVQETGARVTADSLPSITGDEAQLGQVIQNLIGNAIKYARPGVPPIIHLGAVVEKDEWVICVRDNGIGIEDDYCDMIFAPFKRLHGKDVPGTGIGLAICRRVIEAHGGRIWVTSVAGEGSSFCFSLPASSAVMASPA